MRKFSLVIVAAMLLVTGNVLANTTENVKPVKSLSAQISKMLAKSFYAEISEEKTAQVRFTLNNEGEIVVLSVDTEYKGVESFVKSRLNYKKVEVPNLEEGKLYTIPVRIKS